MPPQPLIHNPRLRNVALTALMAAALLLALATARLTTNASLASPMGPALNRAAMANVEYGAPRGWQPHPTVPDLWIDPSRPVRQLRVRRVDLPTNELEIAFAEFLRQIPGFREASRPYYVTNPDTGRATATQIGYSEPDPDNNRPALQHYVALIQYPGIARRYWAVHLVDLPQRGASLPNLRLLQGVVNQTRLITN